MVQIINDYPLQTTFIAHQEQVPILTKYFHCVVSVIQVNYAYVEKKKGYCDRRRKKTSQAVLLFDITAKSHVNFIGLA